MNIMCIALFDKIADLWYNACVAGLGKGFLSLQKAQYKLVEYPYVRRLSSCSATQIG